MSSITKDTHVPPKSPYWIACFDGIGNDGKVQRFKRSTKTTDRKLAQKLATEWEAAAKLAGKGRLTESHARKVMSDLYEQLVGEPLHFRTARAYLLEWLEDQKANIELATYWRYFSAINDFLDHLGRAKSERLLREITPADIRSWRDKLKGEGRAAPTVNGYLKVLRMPFKAAHDNGYIDINPCTKNSVRLLKDTAQDVEKDVFTPEQVGQLIAAAPSEDWQGLILCGFFTGLRLRDCSELKWGNVDMEKQIITVTTRKTKKKVVVPIHPRFGAWLLRRKIRGVGLAPVFPSLAGKSGSGKSGLSMAFSRIMARAGIRGRLLRALNVREPLAKSALSSQFWIQTIGERELGILNVAGRMNLPARQTGRCPINRSRQRHLFAWSCQRKTGNNFRLKKLQTFRYSPSATCRSSGR